MQGRRPIPTATKILNGTYRTDRAHSEPKPPAGIPTCPRWLDKTAKAKWKELAPLLEKMGVLTLADADVLAAYCQAYAEFRQATETLQKEGRYTQRGTGGKCSHPAVAQQRSAWKAMQQLGGLLGLNPSDRARIDVSKEPIAKVASRKRATDYAI